MTTTTYKEEVMTIKWQQKGGDCWQSQTMEVWGYGFGKLRMKLYQTCRQTQIGDTAWRGELCYANGRPAGRLEVRPVAPAGEGAYNWHEALGNLCEVKALAAIAITAANEGRIAKRPNVEAQIGWASLPQQLTQRKAS